MTQAQESSINEIIAKQRILYKAVIDCTHFNETQDINMIGNWVDQLCLNSREDYQTGYDAVRIVTQFFGLRPTQGVNVNYLAEFIGYTVHKYYLRIGEFGNKPKGE